jgi:hypothetical protein
LPAPAWLLAVLLVTTFAAHTVPMNLLLGGAIIGAVAHLRGRRDGMSAVLALWIARLTPFLVAATVTFGVATLLFLQVLYGRVFFATAVLLAVPWLAIVPALVVAYYSSYWNAARSDASRVGGWAPAPWVSWLVAALVMGVALVQSNVMSLMLRPQVLGVWFQAGASGLRLNLADPSLVPRFLHTVVGAVAVAGVAVAVGGHLLRDRDGTASAWMIRHGVLWATVATTVNLLPGFWWLATLPPATLARFMGRDIVATFCLAGGVLGALAAVGHLIPAAFAARPRPLLAGGAGSLATSVLLMVGVRDIVRRAALRSAGFEVTAWVAPQLGAIALFGLLLAGGVVAIVWLIRTAARPPRLGHRASECR